MFMKDDKKKTATMIVAKISKKPGSESESMSESPKNEMGDEMDNSVAYKASADDILRAIDSKNPEKLISSLKSFIQMCNDEHEDSEESEQESSSSDE